MNLKKALHSQAVQLALAGDSKEGVIVELVDLLAHTGLIKDRDAALKAVLEREKRMSTGMQHGIAIPHGKSDTVDTVVAAVGISKEGIDFDSIDKRPSRIFVLTVSPKHRTGPHIQFLAEVSRLLNDGGVRDQVLNAASPAEVIKILAG